MFFYICFSMAWVHSLLIPLYPPHTPYQHLYNWVGTENPFEQYSYTWSPIKAIRENIKCPRGLPRQPP